MTRREGIEAEKFRRIVISIFDVLDDIEDRETALKALAYAAGGEAYHYITETNEPLEAVVETLIAHVKEAIAQHEEEVNAADEEMPQTDGPSPHTTKAVHQSLCELLDKGKIQVVGRTVNGQAVFAATKPRSFTKRISGQLRFTLIIPAIIGEYFAAYAANALAALVDEPPRLVYSLDAVANALHEWRADFHELDPYSQWLTIKPYDCD
jgi:hypothetical protein